MNIQNLALFSIKKLGFKGKHEEKGELKKYERFNEYGNLGEYEEVVMIRKPDDSFIPIAGLSPLTEEQVLDRALKARENAIANKDAINCVTCKNPLTFNLPTQFYSSREAREDAVYDRALSFAGEYGVSLDICNNYAYFALKCYDCYVKDRINNPLPYDIYPLRKNECYIPVIFFVMHEMLIDMDKKVENPIDLKKEDINKYMDRAEKNIKKYIDGELNKKNDFESSLLIPTKKQDILA